MSKKAWIIFMSKKTWKRKLRKVCSWRYKLAFHFVFAFWEVFAFTWLFRALKLPHPTNPLTERWQWMSVKSQGLFHMSMANCGVKAQGGDTCFWSSGNRRTESITLSALSAVQFIHFSGKELTPPPLLQGPYLPFWLKKTYLSQWTTVTINQHLGTCLPITRLS